MSDYLFSTNFSQDIDNFSFWNEVVMDGALPNQFLQDDDCSENTNSQGLQHNAGYSGKDVFPLNSCKEINLTQCIMGLDNSGAEILTFNDNSAINCHMQTHFDLNNHDLLQRESYGLDENMMNCINVFQINNLPVFPGTGNDCTERVDDVEQSSSSSAKKITKVIMEESFTKQDDYFKVSDCDLVSNNQDEFSKRIDPVEEPFCCCSPMETNKQMTDEIFMTEACTACDDVFQLSDISQLFGPQDDCSERGDTVLESSHCTSNKSTDMMVDEIFIEQNSDFSDSSNGESVIYESYSGDQLNLDPTSQQSISCSPKKDSKSDAVVNFLVEASGVTTSLPVLHNLTEGMNADHCASKRVVLKVIRKLNNNSGTKMTTLRTGYTDVFQNTCQPSTVPCERDIIINHRSTGDESDSTVDNSPANLNKNALQARLNREKKKAYIAGLEKQIEIMKREKADLEKKVNSLEEKSAALDDQVMYLKSVLTNDSMLARLISNINGIKTAELSSSSVMSKKRKLDEECGYRGTKVHKPSGASSGVCLHVSNERLSLELCHLCAQSSGSYNRALLLLLVWCFIEP